MRVSGRRSTRWLSRGAEGAAAALLAALFATFLLQIFSRYVLASTFGWTLELCLMLWVWLVFFGSAFVVRDQDHVTFDLLYLAVPRGAKRVFAMLSAAAIVIGLGASLWPTWDYIDFLAIKKSATLRIPLRAVFSIYAVFLLAVILRYAWTFIRLARGGAPHEAHVIHVGEEG